MELKNLLKSKVIQFVVKWSDSHSDIKAITRFTSNNSVNMITIPINFQKFIQILNNYIVRPVLEVQMKLKILPEQKQKSLILLWTRLISLFKIRLWRNDEIDE